MKILVTGSTGFIGRHVVAELLERGHEVTASARDIDHAGKMPWFDQVQFISADLHSPNLDALAVFGTPDVLVHLAWPGLPNYKDPVHFERNLPESYHFIKSMIQAGVKHVMVTGTCFEYGLQSGPLREDLPTFPITPYGLAKDTLRKFLESLQERQAFVMQWLRLFYLYGPGQNPNSLIAQLDRAIDSSDSVFPMSGGEQLRDYLPVQEAAGRIAFLVEHPHCRGIINCCSGSPISVRSLVEKRLRERNSELKLDLGHYPYPDYEPMAFWGDSYKLDNCRGENA
jgi:dTDP-6-deoxy-L-talose 4-dehydrogenase (NAD+)